MPPPHQIVLREWETLSPDTDECVAGLSLGDDSALEDLARELGESPASLAHRYTLSMTGVATVVLGVKNRTELRECIMAQAQGVLAPELMARIDTAVGRA